MEMLNLCCYWPLQREFVPKQNHPIEIVQKRTDGESTSMTAGQEKITLSTHILGAVQI